VIGAALMLKRTPLPADGGPAPVPYAYDQAPSSTGPFAPGQSAPPIANAATGPGSLISALKDELFELERTVSLAVDGCPIRRAQSGV